MTQLAFQMPHIPQTVVIVGCGGTGGRLIAPIAQLMRTSTMLVDPHLVLVDFDEVEHKNLSRQNFIAKDVGKNKAAVLAERYSKAYDLKITPITVAAGSSEYTEALSLYNLQIPLAGPTLYIICVDSANARRQIIGEALRVQQNSVFDSVVIDCGNEDIFGQVSVWTTTSASPDMAMSMETIYNWYQGVIPGTVQGREDGKILVPGIPIPAQFYANMVDGESTRSCADLDQTLAINNMMAAAAVSMAQNILMNKPMSYVQWNFDLFNGIEHVPLTWKLLMERVASNALAPSTARRLADRSQCKSTSFHSIISEIYTKLEGDMFVGATMLKLSESIREIMSMPKFQPSLLMKDRYPDMYNPYLESWNEGYKVPEGNPAIIELYNAFQTEIEAMHREVAEAQAREAAPAT